MRGGAIRDTETLLDLRARAGLEPPVEVAAIHLEESDEAFCLHRLGHRRNLGEVVLYKVLSPDDGARAKSPGEHAHFLSRSCTRGRGRPPL
eukprot:scaffold680_cov264-Pinguiococcus_pyrenoidosus.AAC.12